MDNPPQITRTLARYVVESRFSDLPASVVHDGRRALLNWVGCAVGDYDNDGNLDIFVPNYGRNTLWRGNGAGGFTNTAPAVGVEVLGDAADAGFLQVGGGGEGERSIAASALSIPSCMSLQLKELRSTHTGLPDGRMK